MLCVVKPLANINNNGRLMFVAVYITYGMGFIVGLSGQIDTSIAMAPKHKLKKMYIFGKRAALKGIHKRRLSTKNHFPTMQLKNVYIGFSGVSHKYLLYIE